MYKKNIQLKQLAATIGTEESQQGKQNEYQNFYCQIF